MSEPSRARKAGAILNALVLLVLFILVCGSAVMMLGSKSNATFQPVGSSPQRTSATTR